MMSIDFESIARDLEYDLLEGYTQIFTAKDGRIAKINEAYDEDGDPAYIINQPKGHHPRIFRDLSNALKYLAKEGYEWSETTNENIED